MKISKIRRYRKKHKFINTLITENPVLVTGLNLPFVIAIGVSLKNATAISAEIFCIHMTTMLLGLITVRLFPVWQRVVVNVAISTVTMVVMREFITLAIPDIAESAGIYLSLTALNGMTLLQASYLTRKSKLWPVMSSAFMNAVAFSLVMIMVSAFREYFGKGALWGIPLPAAFKLSGITMPFFGFIFMGFLLAFTKFINKKLLALRIAEIKQKSIPYIEVQR